MRFATFFCLWIAPAIVLACGAPIPVTPEKTGTALFETDDQISTFTASANNLSWDRRTLSNSSVTHIADIATPLTGNIETDPRAMTAISSTASGLVEISATGLTPIVGATGTFGASLDEHLNWQVLSYDNAGNLHLYSETSPGVFAQTAPPLAAGCGFAEMLDVVAEDGGTVVGRCGDQAIVFAQGVASLVALPTAAKGLGRSSTNTATFVGLDADGTSVVVMNRSSDGWAAAAPIPGTLAPAFFIVSNENDFLAVAANSFAWSLHFDGNAWQTSEEFSPNAILLSAHGSPVSVLSGDVELYLQQHTSEGWKTTTLAEIGVPGTYKHATGCDTVNGSVALWIIALIAAAEIARRRRIS